MSEVDQSNNKRMSESIVKSSKGPALHYVHPSSMRREELSSTLTVKGPLDEPVGLKAWWSISRITGTRTHPFVSGNEFCTPLCSFSC